MTELEALADIYSRKLREEAEVKRNYNRLCRNAEKAHQYWLTKGDEVRIAQDALLKRATE